MKVSVHPKALLDRFEVAASCAPKRSSIDILTNVHMEATSDGYLILTGTDTETGIRVKLPCEVESPGLALAPRDRLLAILSESQFDLIEFNATSEMLEVRCGKSVFKLQSADPKEYPRPKMESPAVSASMPFDAFHQAVTHTSYATDPDSTRFSLGGVLLEFDDGACNFVATDGRRLSTVEVPCGGELKRSFIIPSRSLLALCRSKCSGDLVIGEWNNSIIISTDEMQFFAREIDGKFPNWRTVIPKTDDACAIDVGVKPFSSLMRLASITQDVETRGIDMRFDDGRIQAGCATADVGQSSVECECSGVLDDSKLPITIKVDSRFVLEFLKSLHGDDSVTIFVSSGTGPMLITTGNQKYIIMPMAQS